MRSGDNSASFTRQTTKTYDIMQTLPKDPVMLMSVINMKLRDYYPSLDILCEDMEIDRKELETTLASAGFEYSEENKRFL